MEVKVNVINTWYIPMSEAVHRAKFDDDDFNNFRGIACDGQTRTHIHADRQTHTETNVVYINIFKVAYDFGNNNKSPNTRSWTETEFSL